MEISKTFTTGSLGEIISMHAQYYQKNWGFGLFFEAKVARELADFASRQTETDLSLVVTDEHGVAASLILDLHDPDSGDRGAHLRWFITADRCRGTGIGRTLMSRAISHAKEHTNGKAWLTTFAGLNSARHLYESNGFTLYSESEGAAWGSRVTEQEFRR